MKELKTVLNKYANNTPVLGDKSPKKLDNLKSDLAVLARKDKTKVVVRAIAIVLIFFAWLYFVLHWRNDPQKIALIFGASGVSISWLFQRIVELWTEKKASEITLKIVVDVHNEVSTSVVNALAKKL